MDSIKSHVVLDVLGPTVEFLVLPSDCAGDYCVISGTIPPGVSVPIHSHPDDESFFYSLDSFRLLSSGRMSSNGWRRAILVMCLKGSSTLGKTNRMSPRSQ